MGAFLARILRCLGFGPAVVANDANEGGANNAAMIKFDPSQKVVSDGQDFCSVPMQYRGQGAHVSVTGSWLNWEDKIELQKNSKDQALWEGNVNIPLKFNVEYEFKFVVDGEWIVSQDYATKQTDIGTMNNILMLVQDQSAAPADLAATASVIIPGDNVSANKLPLAPSKEATPLVAPTDVVVTEVSEAPASPEESVA